jgi:hypothetical protein
MIFSVDPWKISENGYYPEFFFNFNVYNQKINKMKTLLKLFKYLILPLVVLIIAALVYISIGFGRLEFDDEFVTESNYSTYYPVDYESARNDFRILSTGIASEYNNVEIDQVSVPSKIDNDLTVDLCYIPAQKDSLNLLIISSGVHGAEGFVGHAVQQLFIRRFLTEELLKNTGVLLIHGVNPFGFKYGRRVTENNVDLNRNSPSTSSLYETVNPGYPEVYDLINPQEKADKSTVGNRFFFVKAINEIRKASMPVLRQAVLQGQYQYPEGLYFGGFNPEPQIDSLRNIIGSFSHPYGKILALDLHTGYGERGKLHFFPNPLEGEKREKLEALFEGYTIDWGNSDDFYTITGDFVSFIGALNEGKEFYPMLMEYGTLNSQTTMGSLKSIHIMILENQGHQHGFASAQDSIEVKSDLLEMYYPISESWRNYVLAQTEEVFRTILPRFTGK